MVDKQVYHCRISFTYLQTGSMRSLTDAAVLTWHGGGILCRCQLRLISVTSTCCWCNIMHGHPHIQMEFNRISSHAMNDSRSYHISGVLLRKIWFRNTSSIRIFTTHHLLHCFIVETAIDKQCWRLTTGAISVGFSLGNESAITWFNTLIKCSSKSMNDLTIYGKPLGCFNCVMYQLVNVIYLTLKHAMI